VVKGCRALHLVYGDATTATGQTPETWGEVKGRLVRVDFEAFDPASGAMSRDSVARYAYDDTGRLRAQWDPRIEPTLKTTYDYDDQGLLTRSPHPARSPGPSPTPPKPGTRGPGA